VLRNILLNISSGQEEVTMDEVGQITDYVQEAVGDSASIIWGTGQDAALENKVSVTIIATGFENGLIPEENQQPRATAFQAKRAQTNTSKQTKIQLGEEEEVVEEKLNLTDLKESEIDEIENVPAYKRKLKNLGRQGYQSGKVIKFTLDEE